MEILDLRHLTSTELRPLLEQESRTWGRLLCWDYRSSAEMILRYVDARILPGYASLESGRVSGYSFFVYEASKGVIGDLYVENGRGEGEKSAGETERQLLTHVIETLQGSPGIHRIEAQLLVYPENSVAVSFLAQGFHRYPRLFMVLPLSVQDWRLQALPGTRLRPWREEDFQAAAAVITAAYRNHVDAEINDQYRTLNGALRFLNNIVRFPGCGVFDNRASLVAVDESSGAVIGVILCSRVREDVGHVTQVCVLPGQRGRGIGKALILAACGELQRRGFNSLSLTVTAANRGAVELYRRLGFSINRAFDAFVWEG